MLNSLLLPNVMRHPSAHGSAVIYDVGVALLHSNEFDSDRYIATISYSNSNTYVYKCVISYHWEFYS